MEKVTVKVKQERTSFYDGTQSIRKNISLRSGEVKTLDLTNQVSRFLKGGGLVLATEEDIRKNEIRLRAVDVQAKVSSLSIENINFTAIIFRRASDTIFSDRSKRWTYTYFLNELDKAIKYNIRKSDFVLNCQKGINLLQIFQNTLSKEDLKYISNDVIPDLSEIDYINDVFKDAFNIKNDNDITEQLNIESFFEDKKKHLVKDIQANFTNCTPKKAAFMLFILKKESILSNGFLNQKKKVITNQLSEFLSRDYNSQNIGTWINLLEQEKDLKINYEKYSHPIETTIKDIQNNFVK